MAELAMVLRAATSALRLAGGISEGCQGMGRVALARSDGWMMAVLVIGVPLSIERPDQRSATSLNGLECSASWAFTHFTVKVILRERSNWRIECK
jgi:hypothetical protein